MALPTALIVAGGVLNAGASLSTGSKKASAYRDLADQIMASGLAQAQDFERASSAQMSSGRAARATSGVQLNTGTALIVDENILAEIAKGSSRIREDARRKAEAARREARKAKRAGRFGAASSLLTSAGLAFSGGPAKEVTGGVGSG